MLGNAGSWSFDSDFSRHIIVFSVDNSSSFLAKNPENNFSILDESPNYGINRSFGLTEKKFTINFTKENTNFHFFYIIMLIIVICLLMEKTFLC